MSILSKLFGKKEEIRKVSIRGPIEREGGKLMLKIPLVVGGSDLIACTKGIGVVDGHFLKIEVQPWMANKLGVSEGTVMTVDNTEGEFRMQRADAEEPIQPPEPTSGLAPGRGSS